MWFLGIVSGAGLSSIIIDKIYQDKSHEGSIFKVYLILACASVVIFLLVLLTFQDKPKCAPSPAAIVYRDDDILGTYSELFKNREFILLNFSHMFYFVLIPALYIIRVQLLKSYGYSPLDADKATIMNLSSG